MVFSNLSVIVSVSQRNYKYLLVELVAFAGFFDDYVVFKATILNMAFAEACRPFAGPSLLSRDVSNVNNNIASRSADRWSGRGVSPDDRLDRFQFQSTTSDSLQFADTATSTHGTSTHVAQRSRGAAATAWSAVSAWMWRRQLNRLHARHPVIVRRRRRQSRQSAAARTSVLSRPPTVCLPTTAPQLNVGSLRGNSAPVCDIICTERCGVFAATKPGTTTLPVRRCCPRNYNLVERARPRTATSDEPSTTELSLSSLVHHSNAGSPIL